MSADESVILSAEEKMVNDAQSSSSPWATQFLLLIFFAPIIGIPILIGAAFRAASPEINAGPSQEWSFFLVLVGVAVYFIRSLMKAKESQWMGLSYYGGQEWTDSLRIKGEFIDYGELKAQADPSKPVQAFRYGRPLEIPKAKPGSHLYGILFQRKSIPEIDVALPEHPEKCCKFVGHSGFGYVGWLPWTVKHITFSSFLRTSWTQDPDGTVVPIGVLTDYDLLREDLKKGLEPRVPTKEEMKIAANVRDNYYRDEVVKELEIERGVTKNLKRQLENIDKEVEKRVGAILNMWDKGGKKGRPANEGTTRRQQLVYLIAVAAFVVLGTLALLGKL